MFSIVLKILGGLGIGMYLDDILGYWGAYCGSWGYWVHWKHIGGIGCILGILGILGLLGYLER